MQQLSGQDAMFLHAELDGLPQHIGGVSIYDQSTAPGGQVRFKQILAMLETRLHLSPIFRRKIAFVPYNLGRPYWVEDPDFDLEYHVRHIALPQPGDWRQLCILTARLHAIPLSRDRPLWEMYIIEGLDNIEGYPPNCFALLLKVHHCAMDGATGAQFMNIVHDLSPETRDVGEAPPWVVQKASRARMLGKAYVDAWRKPGQVLDMAKQAGPAYMRIRRGKEAEDFRTLEDKEKTRFQGKISHHRVVDARKFDFEVVRAIKNSQPGTTVNDVMLTIVAGAMRNYLESKGELPDNTLVTGCPIDVRSAEEREAGGNMVGFMNVALRSDIADPAKRLAAVHKEAVASKAFAEALGPRVPIDLADVMPGNVLSLAMRAASATGLSEASVIHNTIVTNVPGAPVQLYMCGARLVEAVSLGPLLPNVGLFHIVYSAVQNKKGAINISFTACRDMMPDPEFYAQCLQDSFDELREATLGAGAKRKQAPKRKAKAAAKTKTKAKTKTAAKAKPKTKRKVAAKAKAKPKAKVKTPAKAKAKAKVKAPDKARTKAKTKAKTKTAVKAKTKTRVKAKAKVKRKSSSK